MDFIANIGLGLQSDLFWLCLLFSFFTWGGGFLLIIGIANPKEAGQTLWTT